MEGGSGNKITDLQKKLARWQTMTISTSHPAGEFQNLYSVRLNHLLSASHHSHFSRKSRCCDWGARRVFDITWKKWSVGIRTNGTLTWLRAITGYFPINAQSWKSSERNLNLYLLIPLALYWGNRISQRSIA